MSAFQASAPLGSLFKTSSGGTPLKARKEYYEGGDIPWLLSGEVAQGEVWTASNFITRNGLENSSAKVFPINTVLVAMYGATAGQVGILKFEATTNQAVCGVFPSERFVPDFLYYFLLSKKDELVGKAVGNAQPNISQAKIRETLVPLVSISDQRRIVTILDEAFEGIATAKANAEKNLKNARELFDNHLLSVFTQLGRQWAEKSIGEVCARLHQGLNTAAEKVKFYDSGYPIIQTRNINQGVVDLDSKMKFMSEEDWQRYKDKYRPEIGDVFFTNIGTIGKTAIVTTDRDYLIHWNIFKLRPIFGTVTPEFLRCTLEQLTLSGYFEKLQKGGTVDFVTKRMISEARIPLATLAEQEAIVAAIDEIREESQRLASLNERKLAALDELKKSLLHQAFNGQL